MKTDFDNLQKLLDQQLEWPALYLFKFIVPQAVKDELLSLFSEFELTLKDSSKGSYVSVSFRAEVTSSAEVVEFYRKAEQVDGVMIL
ncbi:MAG: DUF493 family protein [Bdellovibrionales bacterium]|nr:DUF493 family protein [Bdellovibrionales bacterium]